MMEKLRFRDKDGNNYPNWKRTPFSETYIKAKEGGTPNTSAREYYKDGNIPFVKIDDLKNKYVYEVPSHINDIGLKNSSAWIVPIDSVLLSNGATIGETSINKIEVSTKQGILGIIPRIHNEYLYYLVSSNSFRRDLKKITTKGTMDAAYVKDIAHIRVNLPVRQEQEKIGGFLSSFDKLILKQQEKIGLLKELKKGYLQQMFPEKGSNIPKNRFKGFADAWEQCKFKDVFVKLQNNSLSRADLNDEFGYVMNVHYGDVLIKFNEILDFKTESVPYITEPTIIEKYKNSFLQNGDIIIADAAEDNTVGKCCEIAGLSQEIVLSGLHTIPCRPSKNFASGFLGYYMNSRVYHDQLLPLIQGSKISSISINNLSDTSLVYPKSIEEQSLIANKFRALDKLITLHQNKLESIKEIKNGYMQRLF